MNYELWLMLLNIKNDKKNLYVKEYKTAEDVYNNFEYIVNNDEILRKKFFDYKKDDLYDEVNKLEEEIYRKGLKYITYANPLYQAKLGHITAAPHFLFYKGNIDVINNKSIAVVGARKCSNYGLNVTKLLTKELITNNITLISGGARGIDSIAHKTALEKDGINIAVMGCGIDKIYPPENRELFSEIEKKGVIISEFLPGTKPMPYNFPVRNRIISGLSSGVIVVEASIKSGSLITARYAIAEDKRVLSVPGSIFYRGAQGSNDLLNRKNVTAFSCMDDLKELIGKDYIYIKPMEFTPQKIEILETLSDVPIHIDDIFKNTSVNKGALYALLFEMQMKEEIICLPGNYYIKSL